MNFVPALVLFDLGVSQSVVSSQFCHDFSITRDTLSRTLRVLIPNERPVSATDVYQGCVVEIFGVEYPIYLISIMTGDVFVIAGWIC